MSGSSRIIKVMIVATSSGRVMHVPTDESMGGTFQATARFQDSDSFQKATKMALRCILSVNSHLSGFKL